MPYMKFLIREFGNIKPGAIRIVEQSCAIRPLVDTPVDEKSNTFTINTEILSLVKENIKVTAIENPITIRGEKDQRKHHIDIPLDMEINDISTNTSTSNNILKLKLILKNIKQNQMEKRSK